VDQEGEEDAVSSPAENNNPPSPQCIDAVIQDQGKNMLQLLQMFKAANTTPLSSSILQTPEHKTSIHKDKQVNQDVQPCVGKASVQPSIEKASVQPNQRKSPRLQGKGTKNKSIIQMAQDLVARKCGIIHDEEDLDNIILQQYLDMYKHPLNDESIEAISKLAAVANEDKKKKKKDKKRLLKDGKKKKTEVLLKKTASPTPTPTPTPRS
jgi:hypothetical protein